MNQTYNVIETIASGIHNAGKKLLEWAETIDWQKLNEYLELFQKVLPKGLEILSKDLANKGWFIWLLDDSLSEVVENLSSLLGKEEKDQNILLSKYFESKINFIEKEIIYYYPNRINQIKDAFSTHRHKLYYSSIPALLILAESICIDVYPQIGLYAKHHPRINLGQGRQRKNPKAGRPKTIDIFDEIPKLDIYEEAVLKPLKIKSKITKTIKNPTFQHKCALNRHLIIHGISGSYGSELNSLKAISLIYFVHKSLSFLREKAT